MNSRRNAHIRLDRGNKVVVALGLLLVVLLSEVAVVIGAGIRGGGKMAVQRVQAQTTRKIEAGFDSFEAWRASEVLQELKSAGLDVQTAPGGKMNDEIGMSSRVEEARFQTHAASRIVAGTILTFHSEDELVRMTNYLRALGQSMPAYRSWVFVRDNALVQIDGDLPDERAIQFEEALYSLGE
jgi:hypothetical protein